MKQQASDTTEKPVQIYSIVLATCSCTSKFYA